MVELDKTMLVLGCCGLHHRISNYNCSSCADGFAGATENNLRGVIAIETYPPSNYESSADDKRLTCQRCVKMRKIKSGDNTIKPRYSTYGIYKEPKEWVLCDECHEELLLLQRQSEVTL